MTYNNNKTANQFIYLIVLSRLLQLLTPKEMQETKQSINETIRLIKL